jgi:hypothetical protein
MSSSTARGTTPNPELNNIGTPTSSNATPHTRDPDYYYNDGSIVFLVDGVLFKVELYSSASMIMFEAEACYRFMPHALDLTRRRRYSRVRQISRAPVPSREQATKTL